MVSTRPVTYEKQLGNFWLQTLLESFFPHNAVDFTMSYHYVNFSIRFILQPKKFEYWKYIISAFYNSNYDLAISYDCEDNGLMKAPMYWSFFLYENTV